ncbi:MAG: hypothetical protein J5732_09405 [Bacteroidaceae bacterium]|nr:hypothetical protein [Bacteroidaceae bacterium]
MKFDRIYHSLRLLLCGNPVKRAQYLKKHDILGGIGDNCKWGPWKLPPYPKLIKLHNNVFVHHNAHMAPHDVLNRFFYTVYPNDDFGHWEKLGCIELMDNVYISTRVIIMMNVRINKNCIISAGSVVTSDIPENSIASGIPAKPIGCFDMFAALRRMSKGQTKPFKNQELSDEMVISEWKRFYLKHGSSKDN